MASMPRAGAIYVAACGRRCQASNIGPPPGPGAASAPLRVAEHVVGGACRGGRLRGAQRRPGAATGSPCRHGEAVDRRRFSPRRAGAAEQLFSVFPSRPAGRVSILCGKTPRRVVINSEVSDLQNGERWLVVYAAKQRVVVDARAQPRINHEPLFSFIAPRWLPRPVLEASSAAGSTAVEGDGSTSLKSHPINALTKGSSVKSMEEEKGRTVRTQHVSELKRHCWRRSLIVWRR